MNNVPSVSPGEVDSILSPQPSAMRVGLMITARAKPNEKHRRPDYANGVGLCRKTTERNSAMQHEANVKPLISIVVPAYNEAIVLPLLSDRLKKIIERLDRYEWEILIVNDGSSDDTQQVIERLSEADPCIGTLQLTRNFGKETAMTAGLDHASGQAVVVIDADLQDPPELIAEMLAQWERGFDIVYARRTDRAGESWLKKTTAKFFYRLIRQLSKVDVPADTGDFRLMSRRAVDALLQLREQHRFMKGLFAWVGYPSKAVNYQRAPRAAGKTKFSYWKLWNFAIEGITSFSIFPLKLATYLGISVSIFAFLYGAWKIAKTLIWGDSVAGYPSLIVTILFLGGVQLFFIGVIGEYVGRIYNETKRRPLYVVQLYSPPIQPLTASSQSMSYVDTQRTQLRTERSE